MINKSAKTISTLAPIHKQKGTVTLIISLILLTSITFITLYTSKSIITEQKLANNDFRSRMAFEAAEAGLAAAVTNLSDDVDLDADGVLDGSTSTEYLFDSNADGTRDTNSLSVNTASVDIITLDVSADGDFTIIEITATGWSDDRTAQRIIKRVISTLDPIPNDPQNPLTTRGGVVIGGSATIHNPEGHSTIWSGDDVDLGSNNSTSTNVADVASAGYPSCMDTPLTCSTIQSSNKTLIGLDVVEHDSSLSNLSGDEFFTNFFGVNQTNFRDQFVTLESDHASADGDLDGINGEIIWVDGSGGTTVFSGSSIGTAADPVILIIDGDVEFTGNPTIYGVVFIDGNLTATGNTTMTGAVVVTGITSNASGSLDIYYDSDVLDGPADQRKFGSSSGSWNDIAG